MDPLTLIVCIVAAILIAEEWKKPVPEGMPSVWETLGNLAIVLGMLAAGVASFGLMGGFVYLWWTGVLH
jgi:hypothetical protein